MERNARWANNESSEDQLEAEWSRIHLLQVSDDPWAETRWATFLNLKEAHNHDSEWEHWYSARDEPLPPFIHPEQTAKAERKADRARLNADVDDVLSIAKATPPTLGCKNNPLTRRDTR